MATSYTNNGGTGDRRGDIVVTTNLTSSGLDIGLGVNYNSVQLLAWLDGDTTTANGTFSRQPANQPNNPGDRWVVFDWGLGASIVIDEFKLYFSAVEPAPATWTWEGSQDAISWTVIGATFSLAASGANTIARANTVGYRYYRLHTTSFNGSGGSGPWWEEFEFKLLDVSVPLNYPLLLRPGEVNPNDAKLFAPLFDSQSGHSSWFNSGGKGNRGGFVTVTTDATLAAGAIQNAVDGTTTGFTFNAAQSGKFVRFDFGSGQRVVLDTVIFTMNNTGAHGTWQVQGSNDATNWTSVGAPLTWGGLVGINKNSLGDITVGFRYWQLLNVTGSTNTTVTNQEIEFRVMGLTSIQARVYKLSEYAVILPSQAHVYKLNAYAVLKPFVVGNTAQPVIIVVAG